MIYSFYIVINYLTIFKTHVPLYYSVKASSFIGAPSAVENLDARPEGPEAASITWRPPAQPNGQITGYTLVYRLKSRGECGPRSSQPITRNTKEEEITVEGLLPDSTYEVHVTAHTSEPGRQSNIITVTTDEAGKFIFSLLRNQTIHRCTVIFKFNQSGLWTIFPLALLCKVILFEISRICSNFLFEILSC